ncbi:MAG TPA: DUF2231 domain-containing protein [Pyrinomonadaceae bacterium]|nr:DUF2231 domain-containing protein [Pyrinomonadaceae bacterium]
MESKAKLFGHAIHPILIVFPLGLLTTSVIFDIVYLLTANSVWAIVSFWMIVAGVIGGLVARLFGLIDYLAIPDGTRAKRVGLWHGLLNVIVIILFGISWLLRAGTPEAPPATALALSVLAVMLAAVAGWLGGELVERLGVGVDSGANLDAPSSLSQSELKRPTASPRPT